MFLTLTLTLTLGQVLRLHKFIK